MYSRIGRSSSSAPSPQTPARRSTTSISSGSTDAGAGSSTCVTATGSTPAASGLRCGAPRRTRRWRPARDRAPNRAARRGRARLARHPGGAPVKRRREPELGEPGSIDRSAVERELGDVEWPEPAEEPLNEATEPWATLRELAGDKPRRE